MTNSLRPRESWRVSARRRTQWKKTSRISSAVSRAPPASGLRTLTWTCSVVEQWHAAEIVVATAPVAPSAPWMKQPMSRAAALSKRSSSGGSGDWNSLFVIAPRRSSMLRLR